MTEDRINPSYYKSSDFNIECIEVIEIFDLGYCCGNAFKYLTRWRKKNGLEDLKKALWYAERNGQKGQREFTSFSAGDVKLFDLIVKAFDFDSIEREAFYKLVLKDGSGAWYPLNRLIEREKGQAEIA